MTTHTATAAIWHLRCGGLDMGAASLQMSEGIVRSQGQRVSARIQLQVCVTLHRRKLAACGCSWRTVFRCLFGIRVDKGCSLLPYACLLC